MAKIKRHIKEIRIYDPETGKLLFTGTVKPPPDYVNVVRCRDCKRVEHTGNARWCKLWRGYNGMGDEGYCNYGERKDHETDIRA